MNCEKESVTIIQTLTPSTLTQPYFFFFLYILHHTSILQSSSSPSSSSSCSSSSNGFYSILSSRIHKEMECQRERKVKEEALIPAERIYNHACMHLLRTFASVCVVYKHTKVFVYQGIIYFLQSSLLHLICPSFLSSSAFLPAAEDAFCWLCIFLKNQITRCFAQFSFKVKSWSQNQVMWYFPVHDYSNMYCCWAHNTYSRMKRWKLINAKVYIAIYRTRIFSFSFKNVHSFKEFAVALPCHHRIMSCRIHQIISIASFPVRRQSPPLLLLWICINHYAYVSLSLLFLCPVCIVYERKNLITGEFKGFSY